MQTQQLLIINKLGLHARAAAKMASTAARFSATIKAGVGENLVDSKSVMSLMLLAAAKGTQLTVTAEGEDEQGAIQAIADLIADRFGEEE